MLDRPPPLAGLRPIVVWVIAHSDQIAVDPSGGKIAVGVADGARVGDTKMQVGAHGGASLPVPPVLPPLRNGETAQLEDPKIEEKETDRLRAITRVL